MYLFKDYIISIVLVKKRLEDTKGVITSRK
jgi:hypothetical protein